MFRRGDLVLIVFRMEIVKGTEVLNLSFLTAYSTQIIDGTYIVDIFFDL